MCNSIVSTQVRGGFALHENNRPRCTFSCKRGKFLRNTQKSSFSGYTFTHLNPGEKSKDRHTQKIKRVGGVSEGSRSVDLEPSHTSKCRNTPTLKRGSFDVCNTIHHQRAPDCGVHDWVTRVLFPVHQPIGF